MDGLFVFMSVCPRCGHLRPQDVFHRRVLVRALGLGHLIEGYCAACDDLWPIDVEERTLLARMLSASDTGAPPLQASRNVASR